MFLFMLLAFNVALGRAYKEPVCSRFHYEEQTLKSVVRLEFEMEKLKETLEDILQLSNNTLDTRDKSHEVNIREMFNIKFEKMEKRIGSYVDRLQNIETEIGFQQNHSDYIREKMDEKLEDMEKRLESRLQNVTNDIALSNGISFSATTPSSLSPGYRATLVFTKTMHDSAKSYNTKNGMFKAPLAGTYLFNVQLCLSYGEKWIHYSIFAGSRKLTETLLHDGSHRFCNSATAIVRLEKYEYVYVKVLNALSNALRDNSGERCHFSGALLNTLQ